MKVCVQGLWHLGSVTAAGLASVGHDVIGLDSDGGTIMNLSLGLAPMFEPGLDELIKVGLDAGRLKFSSDARHALDDVDVLWVTFDTPVDEEDRADVEFVRHQVQEVLPFLSNGAVVLVSSQMPVGTVAKLEDFSRQYLPHKLFTFACSPENLRLGKALDVFLNPDRIVVGVRDNAARQVLEKLFEPITERVEWMSVESAEMTKHAINAFLASSVTFANEIAAICELVGADAKEVERGLKTEARIGTKAYLSPGGPFAGGTLARDIAYLCTESQSRNLATPVLSSVRVSNDVHKNWVRRKLLQQFSDLAGVSVAVWGLTYKPGTDTLRRSLAVDLCDWLLAQGSTVYVFDPAVKSLPERWVAKVIHCSNALDAARNAEALVVCTEWPEFKQAATELTLVAQPSLVVVDANRHLQAQLIRSGLQYVAVGSPMGSGGCQ